MNDKRFEAWWVSNPARVALNPAAKEVARGIWRAAQRDMATELLEVNPTPAGASFDALIASLHTKPEYDRRAGRVPPPGCTNSDTWNCKYCNKTATCAALAVQAATPVKRAPC